MVSRKWSRRLAAVGLTLIWAGQASADAIVSSGAAVSPLFKTGNVELDMPQSGNVSIIDGHPLNYTAQPQWMTDAGLVNGYAMKDIRLSYDKTTDTLAVGVNFYGIAGNTDGSPDGGTNPMTIAQHGSNPPDFGADKSVTLAFTPNSAAGANAAPLVVAGVPSNKADVPAGTTLGFNVATFKDSTGGLTYSYGQTLTNNLGNLAYNPSAAHPDFEFTVKNFSKIPGLNALTNGFYLSAYAGSQKTVIVGKSDIANTFVKPQSLSEGNLDPPIGVTPPTPTPEPPKVPEPTTVLAWTLIIGGSAWRYRRRHQSQS